jgi:NAD(P)-dependent dehydrogenase (short-subunit alcohol dehydrogenase family)
MKVILITGGTTGIGFACAEYLVQAGYAVIITGKSARNVNAALEQLGDKALGFVSDTSDIGAIDKLVDSIVKRYDRIDGLFINAGIFNAASFENTTERIFDETMNVNFKGAFFTMQKFLPVLNNPASIVLNTSFVVYKAFSDTSVYTASKAALESIAKVLNLELATRGIRVNIISPGVTESPIQKKSGMSNEAIENLLSYYSDNSPIGRIIRPADIAPILEFLVSEKSLVLRNEKIIVDGGSTI